MMVVMPSFTEREQRYPPTVARVFARVETLSSPHVRGRIHQPGRMEAQSNPQEDAPQHHSPPAESEQPRGEHD